MLTAQRTLRSFAAIGGAAFVLMAVGARLAPGGDDPVSRALLLAVLVLVPLGLALIEANEAEAPYFQLLAYLMPPAAIAGAASVLFDTGPAAGAAASAWVVASLVVAAMGLGRLRSVRAERRAQDLGVAAALLYLPVGAVWLVLSRFGAQPLGLPSILVALTAVHFHHGAFAALVVLATAWSRAERRRPLLTVAMGLAAFAMVVVVAGIVLTASSAGDEDALPIGRALAIAGASMLLGAFVLAAAAHALEVHGRLRHPGAKVLLALAALAPVLTMVLALLYTLDVIELDLMVRAHGETNAYVTLLGALLGWTLERSREGSA